MAEPPQPTRRSEPIWLEPCPDTWIEGLPDTAPGPDVQVELRESVGLAYLSALHLLPPRQRAALVLRDVLGFRSAEVAAMLDTSDASVKGALQRARATLAQRLGPAGRDRSPAPTSARMNDLVARFATAVEEGDTQGLVSLLTDDAWLTMPPEPLEYQGADVIARFLDDRQLRRGTPLRVVPTRANLQPAFGCYVPDAHTPIARAYGLIVITVTTDGVSAITFFADHSLLARFGLPRWLDI